VLEVVRLPPWAGPGGRPTAFILMQEVPMSVVPDSSVIDTLDIQPETVAKLRALEAYDLSHITETFTDRLIKEGRTFSTEQIYPILKHFGRADLDIARRLEREFKRFVALTLIEPGVTRAPPGPVDMYWHYLILHTQDYKRFCEEIWGSFENQPSHA
jgi:hypothetical protein